MQRKLAIVLLLCVVLTSLAGAASGVWLDVPFIHQEKNGCGAAVVWMVEQYWAQQQASGTPVADVHSIQRELYSPQAKGIYASAIEKYFRQRQFQTFTLKGTAADLQHHLAKGRPLIVALSQPRDAFHYVVVAGVDDGQGIVWVNDPAQRKLLKLDAKEFARAWAGAQNWMLLVVPATKP